MGKTSYINEIRDMPIASDVKFRRFFSKFTKETKYILKTLLMPFIPGLKEIKSITSQKHAFDHDMKEKVTDLEIEAEGDGMLWVEMQRWNKSIEEISFSRFDKLRTVQLDTHRNRKCFLVVLCDIKDGSNKLWRGFSDKEAVAYSMRCHEDLGDTDDRIFPSMANGVIIFLNLRKLSERNDEVGNICHDLLATGNTPKRCSAVDIRNNEVFTLKEENNMDIYMRRIVDKENAKVLKEKDEIAKDRDEQKRQKDELKKERDEIKKERDEQKRQRAQSDLVISDLVKIMKSHGISISDISENISSSEYLNSVISAS